MEYDSKHKLYEELLEHYGRVNQIVKAIEELGELQHELCKAIAGNLDMKHLVEEIADVEIMLEQIVKMFGVDRWDVARAFEDKLVRTYVRLQEAKNNEHERCTGTAKEN